LDLVTRIFWLSPHNSGSHLSEMQNVMRSKVGSKSRPREAALGFHQSV
jgi:hypothetical protein